MAKKPFDKEAVLAELSALNVEVTGEETDAQLTKILKDAQKASKPSKDVVSVSYIHPIQGLTTREFSRDVHGEDFEAVAAEFAETHKGQVEE